MNFMKKHYKIFVLFLGILLIIIGFCIILFHKPHDQCEIITVRNDYYVVNKDGENYLSIPFYISLKDSVFTNTEFIENVYLTTKKGDEIIPLSIINFEFLECVEEDNKLYYQYDLKVSVDLKFDVLTIYDNIYLGIQYITLNKISILIGSVCLYNYISNDEVFYTNLKGIIGKYNGCLMLKGVLVKLNTTDDIVIKDIKSLNSHISVSLIDSKVVNDIDNIDLIGDEYKIIGRNDDVNSIEVKDCDYLLICLKYDKYIEIDTTGFIIKYQQEGCLYEKVINPFMFFKNNNQEVELIKVVYESNNYK